MSLDLESPVDRSVSEMRHPGKLLALSLALFGLSFQSCDRAATRPVEEPVSARARIKEDSANHIVVLPSGQTVAFPKKFALPESTMIELAEASVRPPDPALHNQPASTSLARTTANAVLRFPALLNKMTLLPAVSEDGVQTIRVWVSDNTSQMEAYWFRETDAGNIVMVDQASIKGANAKQSRTIHLGRGSNRKFFLMVNAKVPSPNTNNKFVQFSMELEKVSHPVDRFTSQQSNGAPAGGFKADSYVRWLWGGCTTFLVINDSAKDMLLIDAYVDKSTFGNKHYYPVGLLGRTRVIRYVNQIRSLLKDGYKISGVIMTHGHGDHAGDLPYILSGLKLPSERLFLQTGYSLKSVPDTGKIKVYMNTEARFVFPHPSTEYMVAFGLYDTVIDPVIDTTKLGQNGFIYNKPFKVGASFTYGSFSITPHIWYHGNPDGVVSTDHYVRTIAYTVEGMGYNNPAKVFMTGSFIERSEQLEELNTDIPAHHILFADGGAMETARSANHINLLPNPPMGANYIIPTHNDNNSNVYDMDDNAEDAMNFYEQLYRVSVTSLKDDRTSWRGSQRNIRLGYFANRLGD